MGLDQQIKLAAFNIPVDQVCNGRYYPKEVMDRAIKDLNDKCRKKKIKLRKKKLERVLKICSTN